MQFHEKLSIIMDIANTTNHELALYASLDSSHVSRLKNGKRKPVEGASYLTAFSRFLAKRLGSPEQQVLIKRLLVLDLELPFDQTELTDTLHHWLTNDSFKASELPYILKKDIPSPSKDTSVYSLQSTCSIYFKTEGKRLAVLDFFSRIASVDTPLTLLLFSDEDMTWMTGDPNFTEQWSHLMKSFLIKGNRIRIIHDLNRGLDEILSAIASWIPLYMTGAIEPFYYPRIRDGIYKRSLFIVPGLCAVTSSSIGSMTNPAEETATFFFTEKKAINALQKEFDSYLALCRPLMNIFMAEQGASYYDLLRDFDEKSATTIIKTKHLSSISMPENLLLSVLKRNPQADEKQFLALHRFRTQSMAKTLQDNSLTEIFALPSIDDLYQGKIMVDPAFTLGGKSVYYTKEEYRMHLEHVIHLLKHYENYHICIENIPYDLGYSLAAKENTGVIVTKNTPPLVFLSVTENNLALGFWDFLLKLSQKNETNRTSAIEQLTYMIDLLG